MRGLRNLGLRYRTTVFFLVLIATVQPSRLLAQGSVTGSVQGIITDVTGAVMPAVSVTLVNTQTNQVRTTMSGSFGNYDFPNIPIGRYRITAERSGFARIASSEFEVTVQNISTINLSLHVGTEQQTVTVEADAEVVNTSDATLGGLVDNTKVTELPLNGRSFVDLVVLQPGATPIITTGGGRVSPTRNDGGYINGTDDFYNDFTIDGGDYNDVDVPGSAINKALIGTGVPPDAIAEFRVITAAADAEFGTVAGAHITVATKSGTNQFHGTGWEFYRNQDMDARNFFDLSKLPFTLNQFGGVLGGPVKKDKNFFFASYEGYRQSLKTTVVPVVPTPRLLAAIPGGPAYGNLQQLLEAFYPAPDPGYSSTALVAPVHVVENQGNDRDSYIIRDDAHLTDKDTVTARVVSNHATGSPGVILSTGLQGGNNGFGWQTMNPQVTYTRILSNSMVNEARMTFNRTSLNVTFDTPPDAVTALGYSPSALAANSVPSISFSGTGLTNVGWGTSPQGRHVNVFEWTDTLTKTVGRFVIKTGFSAFRYQPNIVGSDTPKPSITFSGFGAPFDTSANGMTTGIFLQQTQTFNVDPLDSSARYPRYSLFAGFEQTSFQARPDLTLTFGLRYEINTIPTERYGSQRNLYALDANGNPTVDIGIPLVPSSALANVVLAQPSAVHLPYAQTHKAEFEPRLGFAWRPFNSKRIVLRGGYGIYYQRPDLYAYSLGTSNPPVSIPTTLTKQVFGTIADPANFLTTNKSISVYNPTNKAISVQSYDLNVQVQTDANGFLQVGYSGSHTLHYNIGTNPNYGSSYSGVRPNTGFLSISEVQDVGNSHYNSLQAEYNHRYGHGFTAQVSYTYSKDIGLAEAGTVPTNLFDFSLDRGPMDADIRQNFVVSLVYNLPWGKGEPMLTSGLLSKVLGNWALSGVSILHSGMPFSLLAGSDVNKDGNTSDRATILAGQSLSAVYASGLGETQFLVPQSQALNVIVSPSAGGLLGRNDMIGPAFFNIDFGLQKNIPVTEHDHFEFRAEFFNIFNHTNFSNPNSTITSPLFGQILSTVSNSRQIQLGLKFYF
jgi:Carboxypeptidase regulatory-like domain